MGGFTQPQGAMESLGFPPEMAGQMRRRGLWLALLNIGQEQDDFGGRVGGSERQSRLLEAMNQGGSVEEDFKTATREPLHRSGWAAHDIGSGQAAHRCTVYASRPPGRYRISHASASDRRYSVVLYSVEN
jgi:hypothetical protein